MYPTAVVYDNKQGAEQYPGPFPASGLPNISPTQHYARPYVQTGSGALAHGVAGRWSTGLCHCFDDPANCKHLKTHLAQSPSSNHKRQIL